MVSKRKLRTIHFFHLGRVSLSVGGVSRRRKLLFSDSIGARDASYKNTRREKVK